MAVRGCGAGGAVDGVVVQAEDGGREGEDGGCGNGVAGVADPGEVGGGGGGWRRLPTRRPRRKARVR